VYQGDRDGLSSVSKVKRTLIEAGRTEARRWVVRDTDRFARYADEVVIEFAVAVKVFVNSDSIDARGEIGIYAEVLGISRDGKKSVTDCLIAVTRKSGR